MKRNRIMRVAGAVGAVLAVVPVAIDTYQLEHHIAPSVGGYLPTPPAADDVALAAIVFAGFGFLGGYFVGWLGARAFHVPPN